MLVRSDEALLWIDMEPGKEPKWSVSIPIELFAGYPLGDYWIDIEARDSGNRTRRLDDAVRFQIRED